jgi:hypothetical protein
MHVIDFDMLEQIAFVIAIPQFIGYVNALKIFAQA